MPARGATSDAIGDDAISDAVEVINPLGAGGLVLVCEHASNRIPDEYGGLGLAPALRRAHIAWDPGALPVARELSRLFDAPLVAARLSRLLYDCNRPPEAPDAIPACSETHPIPGNAALDEGARSARITRIYQPFHAVLASTLAASHRIITGGPAMITVHSFTPVFHGRRRDVEIGILHDSDSRLADAMLEIAPGHSTHRVARNDPYGPEQGVTHTLRRHALPAGLANVMIEIRNDLIASADDQVKMAAMLHGWLAAAMTAAGVMPEVETGAESGAESGTIPMEREETCRK